MTDLAKIKARYPDKQINALGKIDLDNIRWLVAEVELLETENGQLENKLHDIKTWCHAYPETIFIEPTKEQWAEANRVLNEAGGCSLTAISGSNMRHVVKGISDLATLKK